jgi:ABC-type multidrug transport system fused ATPase/permease subunit
VGGALDGSFSGLPGSFTAAGRLGLASAMAPRAGSITGAQWRLAAASAAAMAARKGAESPEEPIDVAAVPTVTVEFDIQHVSMPRRGAASSDAAAAGGDPQPYQCVLNRVQGCFQPYTISCLLGPSGSGKSTLLDVLRGRLLLSPPEEEEQVAPVCSNPVSTWRRGTGAYALTHARSA